MPKPCRGTPNVEAWRSYRFPVMNQDEKLADLKTLSRMAARLSGRDPEEKIVIQIGDIVVFDDVAWRYPDFLKRAEGAYLLLADGLGF